jgi:protein-S-isoprenylcysteine O-methyltransferase Ste14
MVRTHPIIAAVIVIGFALLVLWWVRADYTKRAKLSPCSKALQLLMFLIHALASYSFIDSRFSRIATDSIHFALCMVLMGVGLLATLVCMIQLGWGQTMGSSVSSLEQGGLYHLSRNPQLVLYLVLLTGYALLWPSWLGLAWLALYGIIAHLMVLIEEEHLHRVFGQAYTAYQRRTPRYIGKPWAPGAEK